MHVTKVKIQSAKKDSQTSEISRFIQFKLSNISTRQKYGNEIMCHSLN